MIKIKVHWRDPLFDVSTSYPKGRVIHATEKSKQYVLMQIVVENADEFTSKEIVRAITEKVMPAIDQRECLMSNTDWGKEETGYAYGVYCDSITIPKIFFLNNSPKKNTFLERGKLAAKEQRSIWRCLSKKAA